MSIKGRIVSIRWYLGYVKVGSSGVMVDSTWFVFLSKTAAAIGWGSSARSDALLLCVFTHVVLLAVGIVST